MALLHGGNFIPRPLGRLTQPKELFLLGESYRGQQRREGGRVARWAGPAAPSRHPAGVSVGQGAEGRVHSRPQWCLFGCLGRGGS